MERVGRTEISVSMVTDTTVVSELGVNLMNG